MYVSPFRLLRPYLVRVPANQQELFVDWVIAQEIKRDVELRNKSKRRAGKVIKRWSGLVADMWKRHEHEIVEEITKCGDTRASRVIPRFREVLQVEAYQTFLHYVFHDIRDCAVLESMGVIRDQGDCVEFWCADEPLEHPTMRALLREAKLCRETHEKSQLRLARANYKPFMF